MALTLFDLTYEVATELGIIYESTVVSSSATTSLTDAVLLTQPDNYWNGGTMWVTYDAGASDAAPQGEYSVVSDFINSTNTAIMTTAMTTSLATGDRYAIADKEFPLQMLTQAVNKAIRDAGDIQTVDISSITTAAAQTEYTLPAAANTDLREVFIQTKLSDTNDYKWAELRNWEPEVTAAGTGDKLILPFQPTTSRLLKLVYMAPHGSLDIRTDKLHESIHLERVVYRGAMHALKDYQRKTKDNTDWVNKSIDDYERLAAAADIRHPIRTPQRKAKLMLIDWKVLEEDKAPGGFA